MTSERIFDFCWACILQLWPEDSVHLMVDGGYRKLILVVVEGTLADLPCQSLVMVLDVEVLIEQVVDTYQTLRPLIPQSPTIEIVLRPAVRMKNDQTREMHQLLLKEHRRGNPLIKRLPRSLSPITSAMSRRWN